MQDRVLRGRTHRKRGAMRSNAKIRMIYVATRSSDTVLRVRDRRTSPFAQSFCIRVTGRCILCTYFIFLRFLSLLKISTLIMNERKTFLMENSYLKYQLMKKQGLRQRNDTNIIYLERHIHGELHHLYQELRSQSLLFKEYARMLPTTFDYIMDL